MPPNANRGGQNRGGIYGGLARNPGLLAQVLRFGAHQIGVPYQWGGTTRAGGFDCSGLIYAAYRRAGYAGIGRTTYDQIKQGVSVGINHLKPGDIVFPEPGHEGLYVGNGMVLEAPHTGTNVSLIPLNKFGFWQARRLIRGGGGIIPPRALGGVSRSGLPIPHPSTGQLVPGEMQALQGQMHQQAVMFQRSQTALTNQLASQAAQARQQSLAQGIAQQAQARVTQAQQAQQSLSGGGSPTASGVPAAGQYDQNKGILDTIRNQALQRAGIG